MTARKAVRRIRSAGALAITLVFVAGIGLMSPVEEARAGVPPEDAPEPLSAASSVGPYQYASCRFGTYLPAAHHSSFSIVPKLNAGLHIDFEAWLPSPGPAEAEYIPVMQISQGGAWDRTCQYDGSYSIYPVLNEAFGAVVDANPGTLWIVGNEPDRNTQDNVCPQQYAQAYHDVYTFIKGRDPTAQLATAGLVQVSPMRMDYLDIMWNSYLTRYGELMPVDVWSMHIYILSETGDGDAHFAVGTNHSLAFPYEDPCHYDNGKICHAEHDEMYLFREQVERMRLWMKDHGQQDRPLILTEYGILKPFHYPFPGHPDSDGICSVWTCPSPSNEPDCFCDESNRTFNPARVNAFLTATFDYLRTATGTATVPNLGLPADDYRLVQQWIWYRVATWNPGDLGHAANLADRAQTDPDGEWALTTVGQNWQNYVQAIPPMVNLRAQAVPTTTGYLLPGGDAAVTLLARTTNNGDAVVSGTVTVTFYADAGLSTVLGSTTIGDVPGCARREVSTSMQAVWPTPGAGLRDYWFVLDDAGELTETDEGDNVGQGVVDILGDTCYLPLALRDS